MWTEWENVGDEAWEITIYDRTYTIKPFDIGHRRRLYDIFYTDNGRICALSTMLSFQLAVSVVELHSERTVRRGPLRK